MAADRQRPRYHFLPPANWMNDPNGTIHWQGQYHLFYQHNPYAPRSERIHWGHAVSPDLVHWADMPIALAPTPGATDDDGCWSGCTVDADGAPVLVYTGRSGEHESVCLAVGDGELRTFRKHPSNPVIAGPPIANTTGFRDPYVWREAGVWRMAIGSGIRDGCGRVLLFESTDLIQWNYLGPLIVGDGQPGTMWECPSFFPLDGRHVLIFSPVPTRKVFYLVGEYRSDRFLAEHQGQMDWGGDFYAPQVMRDAAGRQIMFGWSWEAREGEPGRRACWAGQPTAGWAGVHTMPRLLSLSPAGELLMEPVAEVSVLRGAEQNLGPITLSRQAWELPVAGDQLELALTLAPGSTACTLSVRCAPDGSEQTTISYDPKAQILSIDRTRASLSPETLKDVQIAHLALGPDEPLSLRVFLDASIIELYANRRLCMTTRVYPSREDSTGIRLAAESEGAAAKELRAWPMHSIWP
jgi:beta-fructofuranosidase